MIEIRKPNFLPHGFRVYFKQRGQTLIVLLVGGDKTTQPKDIRMALQLARNLPE